MSTTEADVTLMPVRHFSPAAAWMVEQAADALRPTALLVEGPADFNDQLPTLTLPGHRPPLALHGHATLGDHTTRTALFPFCAFSPEWHALTLAAARGLPAAFIDLPWRRLAGLGHLPGGQGPDQELWRRLGVPHLDGLWDATIEAWTGTDWRELHGRSWAIARLVRQESPGPAASTDRLREAFMADQIRRHLQHHGPPLLVVLGAYHAPGVELALAAEQPAPLLDGPLPGELHVVDSSMGLTPLGDEHLARMAAEEPGAGLETPQFYRALWQTRSRARGLDRFVEPLLDDIFTGLERQGLPRPSTADRIAAHACSRTLAHMRGRAVVWREDLVDGLVGALVKDPLPPPDDDLDHPVLRAIHLGLRGQSTGSLDPRTPATPLVQQARGELEAHGLLPHTAEAVDHALAPRSPQSALLHRCRLLALPGFRLLHRASAADPREHWQISADPELLPTLTALSHLGTSLTEAARRQLQDHAHGLDRDALRAAQLAVDASSAGLDPSLEALAAAVERCSDLLQLTEALELLLEDNQPPLHWLTDAAFERSCWLVGGQSRPLEPREQVMAAARTMLRAHRVLDRRDALVGALERVCGVARATPLWRGLALGSLAALGQPNIEAQTAAAMASLERWPEGLGALVAGWLVTGKEVALLDGRLILALDAILQRLDDDSFLDLAAPLRLAFSRFTPQERHDLAALLFPTAAQTMPPITPGALAAARGLTDRLTEVARRQGLRRLDPRTGLVGQALARPEQEAPRSGTDQLDLFAGAAAAATTGEDDEERRKRWRLILGAAAEEALGPGALEEEPWAERDEALGWLYDREQAAGRNIRAGGLGPSQLTVPAWLERVEALFPRAAARRLEADLLDRRPVEELLRDPDWLRRAEPNQALLRAVLRSQRRLRRHRGAVWQQARALVQREVEALRRELSQRLGPRLQAATRQQGRHRAAAIARNFDPGATIRHNLGRWDRERGRLLLDRPRFRGPRAPGAPDREVVILVDQSASMLDSVIHAAVTASIFAGVAGVHASLLAFDADLIDLTDHIADPLEALLGVQLGGGTDVTNALLHAERRLARPRGAVVVLISDLFEGGPVDQMIQAAGRLLEAGATLLVLASLDAEGQERFDLRAATALAARGAHVAAMTPEALTDWVVDRWRGGE